MRSSRLYLAVALITHDSSACGVSSNVKIQQNAGPDFGRLVGQSMSVYLLELRFKTVSGVFSRQAVEAYELVS